MNDEQKQFIDHWQRTAQDWYMETCNHVDRPNEAIQVALDIIDHLLDAMMFYHDEVGYLQHELDSRESMIDKLETHRNILQAELVLREAGK